MERSEELYKAYALNCQQEHVIPTSSEMFRVAYVVGLADGQQSAPGAIEIMRQVRLDIWTSQVLSNPQTRFNKINDVLAKLDAVLGPVSGNERLETLFPNLRSTK